MSLRKPSRYTRLPPSSDSGEEEQEDCIQAVEHYRSPLRTALTSLALLLLGIILLALSILHLRGSLGRHTVDGAGWGLFTLGTIALLPGLYGTGMLYQLSDFVSAPSRGDLAHRLHAAPDFPPHLQHCLLSGPERSGKTSLLFHFALVAARASQSVLLLCSRQKLEQVPPLLPEGVQHTDPAWQRVQIKYLADGQQLLRYAASLHLLDVLPDVVLVDDLHALLGLPASAGGGPPPERRFGGGGMGGGREMAVCRVLAVLHDAVAYMSQRRGRPCVLVAAEASQGEGPRSLYISQRWLPLVLTIKGLGGGRFGLSALPTPGSGPLPGWHAEYSLKQPCLRLEAVIAPA